MSAAYRILDEPSGRNAAKFVINPFWPLIAMMFAGAWLAALLFVLNAWFLRGPTWRREITLAFVMLLGSAAILLTIALEGGAGILPKAGIKYALLLVVVWKLSFVYWIYFLQQTAFALHEYFESHHGAKQQLPIGLILLGAGFFIRDAVTNAFDSPYWMIVVN